MPARDERIHTRLLFAAFLACIKVEPHAAGK
jgi:hypothetical protein